MVRDRGLEPLRLSTLEPKSRPSTHSGNPPYKVKRPDISAEPLLSLVMEFALDLITEVLRLVYDSLSGFRNHHCDTYDRNNYLSDPESNLATSFSLSVSHDQIHLP